MSELEQLELATSRQIVDRLDEEAAVLREGWIALGQALDVANHPFDEQAALAQLQRTLENKQLVAKAQALQHSDSHPYAGFLLAAALVIVAAITIGIVQRPHDGTIATVTSGKAIEPDNSGAAAPSPWADDLDADLDAAALRIQEVSWQPTSLDASLIELDGRMVELSSDISGESL